MRYYETVYIINPNLGDEDYQDIVTKFNNLVEKNSGVVTKVDEWGEKTLAYNVKKFDRGYYVLMQYCGGPDIAGVLKRDLGLDDRIIKYQTIKLSNDVDPASLLKVEPDAEKAQEGREAEDIEDSSREDEGKNGV